MKTEIKFSHKYSKLNRAFTPLNKNARLLLVVKVHYRDLPEAFIDYDTTYYSIKGPDKYSLPKTDLILLIFQSSAFGRVFTTLRRYTPRKWAYYKSMENSIFSVNILSEEEE